MRLEVIDFPSDPNTELVPAIREKLCANLHRAAESVDAAAKLREVLSFTAKKLAEAEKECKANAKVALEARKAEQQAAQDEAE